MATFRLSEAVRALVSRLAIVPLQATESVGIPALGALAATRDGVAAPR